MPGFCQAGDCDSEQVDLRWRGGSVRFSVEVVDTVETRAKGLMFREALPRYSGMLFVYDTPQPVAFWMKNTLIPLDMIFLDQQGRVVNVHENAKPLDLTSIFGGDAVSAVLEINGGLSARLGLGPGAEMRHPSFAQEIAVWPCPKTLN